MSMTSTRIPYLAAVEAVRWDPITGCSNGPDICAVSAECWARKMEKIQSCMNSECEAALGDADCIWRETNGGGACWPDLFVPTFHPETLQAPLRTRKSRVIAVGFGGDMWSDVVDPEWRRQVFEVEERCPGHVFVHLTKNPDKILEKELPNQDHIWIGASVCRTEDVARVWAIGQGYTYLTPKVHRWISFEPLIGPLDMESEPWLDSLPYIQFVVIGGLSNGAGQVVRPEDCGTRPEWVQPILDAAHETGCKVFLKNLQPIIKQLIDPRTGKAFTNQNEWREVPEEWKL